MALSLYVVFDLLLVTLGIQSPHAKCHLHYHQPVLFDPVKGPGHHHLHICPVVYLNYGQYRMNIESTCKQSRVLSVEPKDKRTDY